MLTKTFRNLIAGCFVISLAHAGGDGKCTETWTLTTKKSGKKQLLHKLHPSADTSTITVKYYPDRTKKCKLGDNYHKYTKINTFVNEWFTIEKVNGVDKENNRINFQIQGMKNRWLYYLEHDGTAFLKHLCENGISDIPNSADINCECGNPNTPATPAYAETACDKCKKCIPKGALMESCRVRTCSWNVCMDCKSQGVAAQLKRGSDNGKVFGFRVPMQKQGGRSASFSNTKGSDLRAIFDAVSVRVYLNDNNKVDHIEIPNWIDDKRMTIVSIDGYDKTDKVVTLHAGLAGDQKRKASDRKLFFGGTDPTGEEGRKFLKFLVDHLDETCIDDPRINTFTGCSSGLEREHGHHSHQWVGHRLSACTSQRPLSVWRRCR